MGNWEFRVACRSATLAPDQTATWSEAARGETLISSMPTMLKAATEAAAVNAHRQRRSERD
jgi:hypothetical protein